MLTTLRRLSVYFRWTPHPVIATIRDSNYIKVFLFLLYHYYRVGGPPKVYWDYKCLNNENAILRHITRTLGLEQGFRVRKALKYISIVGLGV